MSDQDPLVICDERGCLWRLWPGIGAWPIEHEDELRNLAAIRALKPSMAMLAELEITGGARWRLIGWEACPDCGGQGWSEADAVTVGEWEIDEEGRSYATTAREYPDCALCCGSGWAYTWGELVEARELLGAEAVA